MYYHFDNMGAPESVDRFLPLKPVVFDLLVVLLDGERHGYALAKALDQRSSGRSIQPTNLYRLLHRLVDRGLIAHAGRQRDPQVNEERRRFFRLAELGRAVARAEAERLELLVAEARAKQLLPAHPKVPR